MVKSELKVSFQRMGDDLHFYFLILSKPSDFISFDPDILSLSLRMECFGKAIDIAIIPIAWDVPNLLEILLL